MTSWLMSMALVLAVSGGCNRGHSGNPTSAGTTAAHSTTLSAVENLAYEDEASKSQSIPPKVVFSAHGGGVAYLAARDGQQYVVHNGKASGLFKTISHLVISPDGKHVAHDVLQSNGKRRIYVDDRPGAEFDDVWQPVFSPDSLHVAYLAQTNNLTYVVVDGSRSRTGIPSFNGNPLFNADSNRVIYAQSPSPSMGARLVVSDLALHELMTIPCEGMYEPTLSRDAKKLIVLEQHPGSANVVVVDLEKPSKIFTGPRYDSIEKLAFGRDDVSPVYVAHKAKQRLVVYKGVDELLPEYEASSLPVTYGSKQGIGVLLKGTAGVKLYQTDPKGFVGTSYDEAGQLVYDQTGKQYAFCARRGKNYLMVLNGIESPPYDMVISPMFTNDGTRLYFRARKEGKRFVVVMGSDDHVVRQHSTYDMVFDTEFTDDNKSIAYGVKDGNRLDWKIEPR